MYPRWWHKKIEGVVVLTPEDFKEKMVGFFHFALKNQFLNKNPDKFDDPILYTTKELLDIYLKELKEKV